MLQAIVEFRNEHEWLSNFHNSVVRFVHPSLGPTATWTVEHAFASCKTWDSEAAKQILNAPTPGKAKRLGRKAPLRADWEVVKVDVMAWLIDSKFSPENNPELHDLLLQTGEAILVEGNWWGDTFWGVSDGRGQNMLGQILMETRHALRHDD